MVDAQFDGNRNTLTVSPPARSSKQDDILKVSLLGGFAIAAPGCEANLPSRKAQAILAYLMLVPAHSETRERIAGLLWSSAPEEQARASLRQALRRLNQYFEKVGHSAIEVTRNEIRLRTDAFISDLWTILDQDAKAPVHPILLQRSDISSSLLLGFEDLDPAFGSWITVQRQILHDRLVVSLEARISDHTRSDEPHAERISKNAALALSNLDPTHEGACRELMLQHVRTGDIASALKRYNRLWSLLEADYDMEPSDETKALVALIKSGTAPDATAQNGNDAIVRAARNAVGAPRLVVGTFSDAGLPEPLRFMARAFRHQFMSSLLKFREWLVIDGERTESVKGLVALDPSYRVEADAFVKEAVLHVLVSVRDTASDTILWSEESPASLETWPRSLKQLVQKLAVAVNVHLSLGRSGLSASDAPVSPSIHDRWLLGRGLMRRWTPASWSQATDTFDAIVVDAPDFAPGLSSRSLSSSMKGFVCPGYQTDVETEEEALEFAQRSIEAGPRDTKSYHASGWANLQVGAFERAILCFGIAENLNQNDVGTAISSALGLAFCGETAEAVRRIEAPRETDSSYRPLNWCFETACRYLCRDYPGTIWAAAKAGENNVLYPPAWAAAAFAHLGNGKAAEREAERFLSTARENWIGEMPPLPGDIAQWFLSAFRFRNAEDYFHLKHGLERAGLAAR
ncbi:BTAD domain-containing putative transcriptional regulator [Nisaea sediminum]|uniref:BTAD domain-containing putative transcriptional regulator n=1 Tax=Nisaea sediminum TaxID=2775867 RepID=UPI001865D224|nr:BTAD domain-containing putative transcriptional regulator [Nisaea sediminum]